MPAYTVGFVYVLSNKAMPGLVKIGMTTSLAEDRAKQLHKTGVPLPFDVEFRSATSHPRAVEDEAQTTLGLFRVAPNREFFRATPSQAIDAVRDALLYKAGLASWTSDEQHFVKSGDRIALTMEAGDLFVVMSYPHFTARRAEPIDFWQAHSDGDLMELMGTDNPGHVAGFSDGDPEGDTDPVPYLDRFDRAPNGPVNGRERLVPGERLLWLRPMADGRCCMLVIFEMRNYCQVTSRTWSPKLDPNGYPLLLNTPTYEELPPCVVRTAQAARRMKFPRTWAPRTPDPTEGWAPVADKPQPPEYWLTQLKPPQRRRK